MRKSQPLFDRGEREAWTLPEQMKPSEWAEKYRTLGDGQSNTPGQWRNEMTPYLVGVMNLPMAEGVWKTHVEKAAQIGVSEAIRNLIGFLADQEPDPIGLTLPDKIKGRKIVATRVIPLFEDNARLRRLLPDKKSDITKEEIKLDNGFILHLAWAGSASSTASDPWRASINDEIDKFAVWGGREPDAVGRTWKRTSTFGERAIQVNISTPTDQFSEIHALVEASSFVLYFFVPCPHCGGWQRLTFGQIKWDKPKEIKDRRRLADHVLADVDRCWYECLHCHEKINEGQKAVMVRAGVWATASGVTSHGKPRKTNLKKRVVFDAVAVEKWPRGTELGLRIWKGYSLLGDTWSGIVAEFLRAQGDLEKLYNFTTETLGEPFRQQLQRANEGVFRDKVERAELPEGIVPAWAGKLLAAIDTQIDSFYIVIRAWGEDFRSQRIWHGHVATFEEIERWCFATPFACEDEQLGAMMCEMAGIDSGGTTDVGAKTSRTMQVYRWTQKHRARIRALKGAEKSRSGQLIWRGRGLLDESGKGSVKRKREVPIWWLAKHHWQSVLADLINRGIKRNKGDEEEIWLLNQREDEEYEKHMANARQIITHHGGRPEEIWQPVHSASRWDYRDCEVYQCVIANLARVDLLPSTEEIIHFRREMYKQAREAQTRTPDVRDGGDWVPQGEESWL